MPKKRKLGSANPKYHIVELTKDEEVIVKRHECDAVIRDSSGNIVPGITAAVHSIWNKRRDKKNG